MGGRRTAPWGRMERRIRLYTGNMAYIPRDISQALGPEFNVIAESGVGVVYSPQLPIRAVLRALEVLRLRLELKQENKEGGNDEQG